MRDGGSKDETCAIVREYVGRDAVQLVSQPDKGLYDAVRKGFATAQGEVLAWINGDDFCLPFTLAMVERVFNARPEIQWLTGGGQAPFAILKPSTGAFAQQSSDSIGPIRHAFRRRKQAFP